MHCGILNTDFTGYIQQKYFLLMLMERFIYFQRQKRKLFISPVASLFLVARDVSSSLNCPDLYYPKVGRRQHSIRNVWRPQAVPAYAYSLQHVSCLYLNELVVQAKRNKGDLHVDWLLSKCAKYLFVISFNKKTELNLCQNLSWKMSVARQ